MHKSFVCCYRDSHVAEAKGGLPVRLHLPTVCVPICCLQVWEADIMANGTMATRCMLGFETTTRLRRDMALGSLRHLQI